MANRPNKTQQLEAAYKRAAIWQQAVSDMRKVALNTTITPHWIDGDNFWYRRQTATGDEFRLVNAKNTTNELAFDHQCLAAVLTEAAQQTVSSENLPITQVDITLSPKQVTFIAFNKRWRFSDKRAIECLDENPLPPPDWEISPDGTKAAFVKDYNLWLHDLTTGEEHALTHDGEEFFAYGDCSRAWGVHFHFYGVQARWSPDGKRLFTVQVDNRQVKTTPIVRHVPTDGNIRPTVTENRVALPGDENIETNRILSVEVDSGHIQAANYRQVPTNRSAHGLFKDRLAWWGGDSQKAYFVDTERGEKVARVVEFDTHTGATRILFEETSNTYIKLSLNKMDDATICPLPESNELIWYSERSGWAHLYLYDLATGQLKRPLTQGDWLVRQILHIDYIRRELYFQATGRVRGRDPYYQEICRVHIDTGEITTLASSDHEYSIITSCSVDYLGLPFTDPDIALNTQGVSPNANYLVTTRSRVDQIPVTLLIDRDGNTVLELETAVVNDAGNNWTWPEPVSLKAADGEADICGVIFRPSNFSPKQAYPVIDASLCFAELATVPKGSFDNNASGGIWYLQAAALAELGFIVVMIDGRGTPYREKHFVDASYGWAPSINFVEDRINGLKQIAVQYSYMDLKRVGSMSFNAFIGTVYDLFQYPDFYQVGVSHGFSDPQLTSVLNSEYFEGTGPDTGNQKRAEELVGNLNGKLLLLHGMANSMSHPAGTFRLVEALQKANKDFDMLMLPNEGESAHIGSDYAFRRTWDYFVKHLLGIEPPKEFDFPQ